MLTNFEIEISKQIKCKFFDLGKVNRTNTLESGPPLKKMVEIRHNPVNPSFFNWPPTEQTLSDLEVKPQNIQILVCTIKAIQVEEKQKCFLLDFNNTSTKSQKKVYHVLRGHNSPKNGTRNKSRVIFEILRSSSFWWALKFFIFDHGGLSKLGLKWVTP